MKKLLIVIASVLFVSTGIMTFLFIKSNNSKNDFIGLARGCMTSYSTAIDYIMCNYDYEIGNLKSFETCKPYSDITIKETEFIREMGYEPNYHYIGK